jgi:hypothetical protein
MCVCDGIKQSRPGQPKDSQSEHHNNTTTMKLYSSTFALCALSSTTAFVIQPKTRPLVSLRSSYEEAMGGPPVKASDAAPPEQTPAPGGPSSPLASTSPPAATMQKSKDIWDTLSPITVQGGALRTWSFTTNVETVQVLLKTEGRPLNSDIELWQGPDNTPQRMQVYIEDGSIRPFSAMIGTPRDSNAIAVYNTAPLEYPLQACVEAGDTPASLGELTEELANHGRIVQGGAVYTCPFDASVESVQVLFETDGRPLNARLELLQGPNNIKQVVELYTEDGIERPFYCVLDTPGSGNVVRVVNTATVEFPLTASVQPYQVQS